MKMMAELTRIAKSVPEATWYLFGSTLIDANAALDIDVLIVYSRDQDGDLIRSSLSEFCLDFPVHLLLISQEEEQELNFVETQRCKQIYPAEVG
jgi:hypothetical protein